MARRELAALDSNLDRGVWAGPAALGLDGDRGPAALTLDPNLNPKP